MTRLAVDHLLERHWWRAVGWWIVPFGLGIGAYVAACLKGMLELWNSV